MQAFEYAHPESVKDAVAMLGPGWADAEVLAGGTDLLSSDEGLRRRAEARGEHQGDRRAGRN